MFVGALKQVGMRLAQSKCVWRNRNEQYGILSASKANKVTSSGFATTSSPMIDTFPELKCSFSVSVSPNLAHCCWSPTVNQQDISHLNRDLSLSHSANKQVHHKRTLLLAGFLLTTAW
nr:hypothetical protein Itr_chr02CG12060 [Ipomoea trifida]